MNITQNGLRWIYGISCATVIAALASTLVGLPMFRFGIWFQSEPIFFVVLICAAIMSGLLMLLVRAGEPIGIPLRHPAMQLYTLFTLWGVVSSMFAGAPMRSMFGAPETAEGVLWYGSIWVGALLICAILRDGRFVKHLFWGQWAVVLVTTTVQIGFSEALTIFKWGDYLGIIAMYYAISMIYAFRHFTHPIIRIILVLPAPFALLVSDNNAAILIAGLFIAAAAAWWALSRYAFVQRYGRYIALIALIPPLVGALAGTSTTVSCGIVDMVKIAYSYYPSCDAEDPKVFNNSTIGSRVLFNSVAKDAITEKPLYLLAGAGYGTYADLFYRHAFTGNVANYVNDSYEPNWIFGQGHVFHPHHSWVYILISTGIPGFIFWLGTMLALFFFLKGNTLIAMASGWLAVLTLLSVWFAVPMIAPFMAMALATSIPITRSAPSLAKLTPVRPNIKYAALGCTLITCIIAAYIVRDVGTRSEAELGKIVHGTDSVSYTALPDYGRGYMHQWWLALSFSDYLNAKRRNNVAYTENDVIWTSVILRILEDGQRSPQRSLRVDGHYVSFMNDLMLFYSPASSLWHPLVHQYSDQWRVVIQDYLLKVPTRGDVAAPFFEFWLQKFFSDNESVKQVARSNIVWPAEGVLNVYPDHPIANWYAGRVLYVNPATREKGLERLRGALANRVDRFVPVSKEMRALINKSAPTQ